MCKAAEAIAHRFEVDEAELLLWVDYASIPQANANMQKAAIASLGVYARACQWFVTIAPECAHHDRRDARGVPREWSLPPVTAAPPRL